MESKDNKLTKQKKRSNVSSASSNPSSPDKNTGGNPAATPRSSPDTKPKSKNASPNVKTGGKTTGGSSASTPQKAPTATADQGSLQPAHMPNKRADERLMPDTKAEVDCLDAYPAFYNELIPTLPLLFRSHKQGVFNPAGKFNPPKWEEYLKDKYSTPKEMEDWAVTKVRDFKPKEPFYTKRGIQILVPVKTEFHYKRDGRKCSFKISKRNVHETSYAAYMYAKDNEGNALWIKCCTDKDSFVDVSMEINMLNALSQDPYGRLFFPRVLFWNYSAEKRLMFGCHDYDRKLLGQINEFKHGVCLHFIRCFLKQMLEIICIIRKYGISTQLNPTNIRMKKGTNKNLEIVLTNLDRATCYDKKSTRFDLYDYVDDYTAADLLFERHDVKKELTEEWSVAAMAYRMLVGEPMTGGDGRYYTERLILGAYEFLGFPAMDLSRKMKKFFKKEGGQMVFRGSLVEKKNKFFEAKLERNKNRPEPLPTSFNELKTYRPSFYKTDDEQNDLVQLVLVIESMLCWDQNDRVSARDMLKYPFFTLQNRSLTEDYKQVALAVYKQDETAIDRLVELCQIDPTQKGKKEHKMRTE